MEADRKIILFDGVCNFCNSSVNFVIDKDSQNKFRFAALQSDPGVVLQKEFGLDPNALASFILVDGDKYYSRSTAALRVAKELKGIWKFAYVFIIVPPFIRNIGYDIIAKYRYKWFGKREACRIPTAEERAKFL